MIYMEHSANKRYFMLVLEQDMLNNWLLRSLYGSLDNRSHGSKLEVFECEKDARDMMFNYENTRRQKGYMYAQYPLEFVFDLIPQTVAEIGAENDVVAIERSTSTNNLNSESVIMIEQLQFGFK